MTKTNSFLAKLRDLLFKQARKASVAFVVASVPAVVTLIQANYGQAVGAEVGAILTTLGVYHVSNA